MARTALIFWDRSGDDEGWAYRLVTPRLGTVCSSARHADCECREESGRVDGDLPKSATLADVLHEAGELPEALRFAPERWTPVEHDGPGWEVRS